MKKTYKAWLHGSKEDAWEYNERFNLEYDTDSDAFGEFVYTLYEVQLDMETDNETGETLILGIGGVKLETPVKA